MMRRKFRNMKRTTPPFFVVFPLFLLLEVHDLLSFSSTRTTRTDAFSTLPSTSSLAALQQHHRRVGRHRTTPLVGVVVLRNSNDPHNDIFYSDFEDLWGPSEENDDSENSQDGKELALEFYSVVQERREQEKRKEEQTRKQPPFSKRQEVTREDLFSSSSSEQQRSSAGFFTGQGQSVYSFPQDTPPLYSNADIDFQASGENDNAFDERTLVIPFVVAAAVILVSFYAAVSTGDFAMTMETPADGVVMMESVSNNGHAGGGWNHDAAAAAAVGPSLRDAGEAVEQAKQGSVWL